MIRQTSQMAPYIKHPTTTRGIMLDVMLCMAALYLIATFYYGWRAIMLGVISMAVCMLCEWLGSLMRLVRHNTHDLSALVTGMMIPLMRQADFCLSRCAFRSWYSPILPLFPILRYSGR